MGTAKSPALPGARPMNDISPSPWAASPVARTELAEHFAAVQSWQREQVRQARNSKRLAWGVASAMAAIALASSVSIAALLPLEHQVIVPLVIPKNGMPYVAWSWRDLLTTDREAALTAVLWLYVQSREGYNWEDAHRNYDVVSDMSAPAPRAAYQKWFLPSNKESPQNTIGQHGQIWARFGGIAFEHSYPVAYLRFSRTVQMDGSRPQKTEWSATISYQVNAPMSGPARLFDPEGIEILSYAVREVSAP